MAILREKWLGTGTTPHSEYHARKRDEAAKPEDDEPEQEPLTEEEEAEVAIARYCQKLLKSGIAARSDYETFDLAWELYIGDMWPRGLARWKAKITVNKIRALIHFLQAVMTDNKPRYNINPRVQGTDQAAKLLQKLVDRDWDENNMQNDLSLDVLYGLIWGTGIEKIYYDPRGDGGRGKHLACAVVPYRVYVDPLATCVEDARFLIHIEPRSLGWIFENYPHKALAVKKVRGSKVLSDSVNTRDFIREGQQNFKGENRQNQQQIVGPGIVTPISVTNARDPSDAHPRDDDQEQIEVGEFWFRDERTEHYMRPKRKDGEVVTEDVIDEETGLPELEIDKQTTIPNPLDGTPMPYTVYKAKRRAVMEKAVRPKFPNGRIVMMAGPVVLVDTANPYQTDGFPFASWKNQDVGTFWGQGEPLALKDLNIGINRILGQIYDNLNLTGNPSFLLNKNAGIDMRTLRSRPGLIIPTDDLEHAMKPLDVKQMPPQFFELAKALAEAFNEVSGIADSLRAGNIAGNTAFATVDALQESSSATIRQKVRNLEKMIKRIGKLRIALIQQYDNGERPIAHMDNLEGSSPWTPVYEKGDPEGRVVGIVPPSSAVNVRFQNYVNADLQGQVEFEIVPDSSLSTSPASMWNRYMDLWKNHLIDLESFHAKFELDDWRGIIQRMKAMQAVQASAKKPGPKSGAGAGKKPHPPQPPSNIASRMQLAATR
jgi:hypothetical protein